MKEVQTYWAISGMIDCIGESGEYVKKEDFLKLREVLQIIAYAPSYNYSRWDKSDLADLIEDWQKWAKEALEDDQGNSV